MRKITLEIISIVLCASVFCQSISNTGAKDLSDKEHSLAEIGEAANPMAVRPSPQIAMSSSDYPVTAGDIYTLAFAAGTNAVTYAISVDTTYKIRVANLAVLDVSKMTFAQLKKQVEVIVTKNYPMSGVQFVLATPAVFKVTINGEVRQTEIRQAWALTRVDKLIADLYTPFASKRFVDITSESGETKTYDLFKASRFGDLSNNPYVRPGDIITVPRAERRVRITGQVERSGNYELLKGENLKNLVEYYGGGLAEYANPGRIELTRYFPDKKESKKVYLSEEDIGKNFELNDLDSVYIYAFYDLRPVMFIEGAISKVSATEAATEAADMNRISVQFDYDTNYAFLIRQRKNLFGAISDIENAYIIRGKDIIPIDISKILYDQTYNFEEIVQPYDVLRVPFKQFFVTVAGAVNNPGRYPYIPDRGWDYYVGLAGGFVETKNVNGAIEIVDSSGKKKSKSDPITPETTITAKANSFTYYFGIYAPVITTVLSVVSTTISIIAVTSK